MIKFIRNQADNITVTSILIVLSVPFLWSTWGTGWFTDDYQYLLLYQTKISLGSSVLADLFLFQPAGHIAPVFNLINFMLLTIGKTANGVHVIISIIYIGSGVIVYKISHIISKDKKIAILAATIFILSYDLSIKSLVLNVFHTHATNTFTGLLALLYSIKYLNFGRSKNLILSSLWLLLTIFNYESGLIFIVIIGLFALSQYFKDTILEKRRIIDLCITMVFAVILYASYSFTVSGYLAPVYTKLTGNSLVIESNGGSTLNVGEAKSLPDKTLKTETNHLDSADEPINFLREIRSTYAPRTATVRLTRFVDIFIKTLNLSFVDTFIKPLIIEKSRASINPYVGKKAIIAVLAFVAALSIISLLFAYWLVDRETKPFLVIFFVSAICFSSIYNRSDIVNSLAVLSSIVVSNLTIIGWTKRRNIYFLLALFPAIVIGMGASINAVTGFNLIYPFEKRAVMQTSKVIEAINKVVGGYKEEVYLLVHEQSLLSGPFLNYDVYKAHQDISHANIWYYQDEFARTARGKRYLVGTMFDVETSKELPKHFRIMLVKFKPDFKTIGELDEAELIYVNEQNKITRLSM